MLKKILVTTLTLATTMTLAGCGSTNHNDATTKNGHSTSRLTPKKVIDPQLFASLKVGDLTKNGQGGINYRAVIDQLGKPDLTKHAHIQGRPVEMDTWHNLTGDFASVTLSFGGTGNDRALSSKSYTNANRILTPKTITQADYDAIPTDGSKKLAPLINKFGKPTTYTVTSILDSETKSATWQNLKGNFTKTLTLTISADNTIIGKAK